MTVEQLANTEVRLQLFVRGIVIHFVIVTALEVAVFRSVADEAPVAVV